MTPRHRLVLQAALAFTIGLGLASRKYPGDAWLRRRASVG
jgi:hypothetical protein